MSLLKNKLLSKILIVTVVLPVLSLFLSTCIGALFFSRILKSSPNSTWFFASMFCDFIGFFCGFLVCYKIWPKKNADQTNNSVKQITVGLVFLIWLVNGFMFITTQEYKSDIFWAFVSGGLGGLAFAGPFFIGITLLISIPIFVLKNKSLKNFAWFSKINLGLIFGVIFSFCFLLISTMNT